MIELQGVTARAAPLALAPVTARILPGCTAVLGTKEDGVALLLAVLAGRERVRSGTLRVFGGSLEASRRAIAYVPLDAVLPRSMRVEEVLSLAARVRGDASAPAAALRLEALGVASLARRRVETLSREETRAVCAAEALTSPSVRIILLEEPYATLDARAAKELASCVRARAYAGALVVVATASPREARALASTSLLFERGTLVRQGAHLDDVTLRGEHGLTLHVASPNARALGALLATDADVARLTTRDESLTLQGRDARALAAAVARATRTSGAEVTSMQLVPLALDELRAAHAGDLAGAYRAAEGRARDGAPPPPAPPAPPGPPLPVAPVAPVAAATALGQAPSSAEGSS